MIDDSLLGSSEAGFQYYRGLFATRRKACSFSCGFDAIRYKSHFQGEKCYRSHEEINFAKSLAPSTTYQPAKRKKRKTGENMPERND